MERRKKAIQVLRIPQIAYYVIALVGCFVAFSAFNITQAELIEEYPEYIRGYIAVGNVIGSYFVGFVCIMIFTLIALVLIIAVLHTVLLRIAKKTHTSGNSRRENISIILCQILDIVVGMILAVGTNIVLTRIAGVSILIPSFASIILYHGRYGE